MGVAPLASPGVTRRAAPPSGHPPPEGAATPHGTVDLVALAAETTQRYREQRPHEEAEYGPGVWEAWCRHDTQHLLAWGFSDVHDGLVDLLDQVGWLAGVLASREYPVERLAFGLDLAAEVVAERLGDTAVAARLREAAAAVRDGDGAA